MAQTVYLLCTCVVRNILWLTVHEWEYLFSHRGHRRPGFKHHCGAFPVFSGYIGLQWNAWYNIQAQCVCLLACCSCLSCIPLRCTATTFFCLHRPVCMLCSHCAQGSLKSLKGKKSRAASFAQMATAISSQDAYKLLAEFKGAGSWHACAARALLCLFAVISFCHWFTVFCVKLQQ